MKAMLIILCLVLFACQKEEVKSSVSSTEGKAFEESATTAAEDDFSDLKQKKDESCDDKTAEEIALKAESKAVSLQGGNESDCVVK